MASQEDAPLVTDPFLISITDTSACARRATLSLLELNCPASEASVPSLSSPPAEPATSDQMPRPSLLDTTDAQESLLARIAYLRGQNRRLAHHLRNTKSVTSSSRSEIDTLHLSLQNLYYESRHLAGEISACESYPHKYIQLPLIPESDFLESLPQWLGKNDEEIMKARIESEYQERVGLEEQRKQLAARKLELVKENAKRKEDLVQLDTNLEKFIEASKPIQKAFEKEY